MFDRVHHPSLTDDRGWRIEDRRWKVAKRSFLDLRSSIFDLLLLHRSKISQDRRASFDAHEEALDLQVLVRRMVGLVGVGVGYHEGRHTQQLSPYVIR